MFVEQCRFQASLVPRGGLQLQSAVSAPVALSGPRGAEVGGILFAEL